MLIGAAHIVGGSKWSGKVARTLLAIPRAIVGWPVVWLGAAVVAIGLAIKGKPGGHWALRALRVVLGQPVAWLGQLVRAIGNVVKGGKKKT